MPILLKSINAYLNEAILVVVCQNSLKLGIWWVIWMIAMW